MKINFCTVLFIIMIYTGYSQNKNMASYINNGLFFKPPINKIFKEDVRFDTSKETKYTFQFFIDSGYNLVLTAERDGIQKTEIFDSLVVTTDSVGEYYIRNTSGPVVKLVLLKNLQVMFSRYPSKSALINGGYYGKHGAGNAIIFIVATIYRMATLYCCHNGDHNPSHCATDLAEMQDDTKKFGCKDWK